MSMPDSTRLQIVLSHPRHSHELGPVGDLVEGQPQAKVGRSKRRTGAQGPPGWDPRSRRDPGPQPTSSSSTKQVVLAQHPGGHPPQYGSQLNGSADPGGQCRRAPEPVDRSAMRSNNGRRRRCSEARLARIQSAPVDDSGPSIDLIGARRAQWWRLPAPRRRAVWTVELPRSRPSGRWWAPPNGARSATRTATCSARDPVRQIPQFDGAGPGHRRDGHGAGRNPTGGSSAWDSGWTRPSGNSRPGWPR